MTVHKTAIVFVSIFLLSVTVAGCGIVKIGENNNEKPEAEARHIQPTQSDAESALRRLFLSFKQEKDYKFEKLISLDYRGSRSLLISEARDFMYEVEDIDYNYNVLNEEYQKKAKIDLQWRLVYYKNGGRKTKKGRTSLYFLCTNNGCKLYETGGDKLFTARP